VYKKKKEEVIKSLQGFYKTEELFALLQAFDGAFGRRIATCRGPSVAIKAMARKLAC
jgi:hypothetical protein